MPASLSRRAFLAGSAAAAASAAGAAPALPILDTHQHLWDLTLFRLPWLDDAGPSLRRDCLLADYLAAAEGLGISRAVYMEVNVIPKQRQDEADWVLALCRKADTVTRAAVVAGSPGHARFREYITPFRDTPIKGIRDGLKPGCKDDRAFLAGLRLLGELGMSFDIVCAPSLLDEAVEIVKSCPDIRFILDHCGNADARWFLKSANAEVRRRGEVWIANIAALARRIQD